MRIGELSRRVGVHIETIRYYEKIGLMPAPPRSENRFRSYAAAHVQRLHFIRRARELGFSIDELRSLIRLSETPESACDDVERLATAHLRDVRGKLADLRRMERQLASAVAGCRKGQAESCPLLQTLVLPPPAAAAGSPSP